MKRVNKRRWLCGLASGLVAQEPRLTPRPTSQDAAAGRAASRPARGWVLWRVETEGNVTTSTFLELDVPPWAGRDEAQVVTTTYEWTPEGLRATGGPFVYSYDGGQVQQLVETAGLEKDKGDKDKGAQLIPIVGGAATGSVTDPENNKTMYTFDEAGRVLQQVAADGGKTVWTRDAAGRVTQEN